MKYMCHMFLALFAASTSFAATIDLSTLDKNFEALDGDVLTGTLDGESQHFKITIAKGAKITLRDATINGYNCEVEGDDDCYEWAGLTCLGNCTIVLEGSNTVTGFFAYYPGIQAAKNEGKGEEYTLTIEGEGSLDARSNGDGYGAGIGGEAEGYCGDIIINGGKITATGGVGSAGIGGGYAGYCGNISISDGTVTATGVYDGAGIGSGVFGECGNIIISGGEVTATGGEYAAGIGGGDDGIVVDISISGGTVTATGGIDGAGVGSGYAKNSGNITISGGKVTAVGGENAAGIGGGFSGTSGDIKISGGEVTATGGEYAAGIGGGNVGASGKITITNNVTKVVAIKGDYTDYSVGAGYLGNTGKITIGGTVMETSVEKEIFVFPSSATPLDIIAVGDLTYAYVNGDYSGDAALKIAKDVNVDRVVFDRTFPVIDGENNYSTIMFPFDVSVKDVYNISQAFSFAGIGVDKENRKYVAVEKATKYEAYKPYLIQLDPGETSIIVFSAEPIVFKKTPTKQSAFDVAQSGDYNQHGDYVFRSVVQTKTWGANDPDVLGTDGAAAYGFASASSTGVEVGQFAKVGEGAYIRPFRGYIYKNPVPKKVKSNGGDLLRQTASIDDLPDVMDIVVVDGKKDGTEQTTVIGQFNSRTGEIRMNRTERTYDLKGRSVHDASRMAKGVYFKK